MRTEKSKNMERKIIGKIQWPTQKKCDDEKASNVRERRVTWDQDETISTDRKQQRKHYKQALKCKC